MFIKTLLALGIAGLAATVAPAQMAQPTTTTTQPSTTDSTMSADQMKDMDKSTTTTHRTIKSGHMMHDNGNMAKGHRMCRTTMKNGKSMRVCKNSMAKHHMMKKTTTKTTTKM